MEHTFRHSNRWDFSIPEKFYQIFDVILLLQCKQFIQWIAVIVRDLWERLVMILWTLLTQVLTGQLLLWVEIVLEMSPKVEVLPNSRQFPEQISPQQTLRNIFQSWVCSTNMFERFEFQVCLLLDWSRLAGDGLEALERWGWNNTGVLPSSANLQVKLQFLRALKIFTEIVKILSSNPWHSTEWDFLLLSPFSAVNFALENIRPRLTNCVCSASCSGW